MRGVARALALCTFAVIAAGCGSSGPAPIPLGGACVPNPPKGVAVCADELCLALDNQSGFCTRNCETDSNCADGFLCVGAGKFGKICRKTTGCKVDNDCPSGHTCDATTGNCYIKVARTLCSPCQDDAQCPAGGSCFSAVGSGQQFCTGPCGAGDSCAVGFTCSTIPIGKDQVMTKQCVPTTMTCDSGKTICQHCTGDAECGGPFDLCVRNVVSGETFCGRDCNPAKNVCPAGQPNCDPTSLSTAQNTDCPAAFSCTNIGESSDPTKVGPYQCVPNSNTCVGYCDATGEVGDLRECGLGQTCANNSCKPATDGRMCSPCINNDDCRNGAHPEDRCIVNNCDDCPFKGEAFCSTPCADDTACVVSFGPGFVCKPVDDPSGAVRSYCMPQRGTCASGLGRLGDDCSKSGASDCVAGVCLSAGYQSLCSLACQHDAECGDPRYHCCEYTTSGYDCADAKRTNDGPASGPGVCAPLGGLFGDDCTPGRPPCQTGTCLDLGTAQLCTVACDAQGMCPAGFTCRSATLPGSTPDAGVTTQVCFPNGGGQAGADCTFGPAACASGLCIKKDSGPICSSACTEDSMCPDGWTCQVTRTVDMMSVQACIAPGLE